MMPPEVIDFFEKERKKQQQHNTVAIIQGNVRETVITMNSAITKLNERGQSFNDAEEQMVHLVHSSGDFYFATLPTWKKYAISWIPPKWVRRKLTAIFLLVGLLIVWILLMV